MSDSIAEGVLEKQKQIPQKENSTDTSTTLHALTIISFRIVPRLGVPCHEGEKVLN